MLIRRLARPMLAAVFIAGGAETLRHPAPRVDRADPVPNQIADKLPFNLPQDPETLVKIDAGVKVAAGLLLATGRMPRLASVALIASLVPTTYAGHPFWAESDPKQRAEQSQHFLKNLAMLGGLMLAAVDTSGKPSLRWRAAHAGTAVKAKAVDALPVG